MSEQDDKPETLQDEQAAGGPPAEDLDAAAPDTASDEAAAAEVPTEVAEEPVQETAAPDEPVAEAPEADEPEADEPEADESQAEAKPKRARKPKAEEPKAEEPPKEAPAPAKAAASANGQAHVVRAQAKYVRTSARKARLVCDHLRGKSVVEARAILLHTPRHVARDWSKLLESAVANAEHNHELVGDELRILSITADEGPTIKRFRPRAQGRATRIRKRTAHLSIALTTKES